MKYKLMARLMLHEQEMRDRQHQSNEIISDIIVALIIFCVALIWTVVN